MIYCLKFFTHLGLVFLSFIASYSLRRGLGLDWWISDPSASMVLVWAAIYALIAGVYELILRNERRAWSYASITDLGRLIQAATLTGLTFLALIFISNRGITLPRSTLILSWLISLFALLSVRIAWRLFTEGSLRTFFFGIRAKRASGAKSLFVVGNSRAVMAYMRRHASHPPEEYEPVALVVDEPGLVGQMIHGVPVIGVRDRLEAILEAASHRKPEDSAVLFTEEPIHEMGLGAELIGRLRVKHYRLLRQPSVAELKVKGGEALREISLEELLPREPVRLDSAAVVELVAGKRALVTGAGGSIGSEICRQLAALGCAHITLVDHSEFLLFEIDRDLAICSPGVSKNAFLCDVRVAARMEQIAKDERPDIVFHAAALKHVTLVEQNPAEAVLTNVMGTMNVVRAAKSAKATHCVLISTDKAVDPTSFMGATKRLAESIMPGSTANVRYCVVRFGNVLGSAGSVVPIFKGQIERGGPVTVTHRDVERYFMTIPEAVLLVLHAAAINATGETPQTRKFLLDMGKPVKIYDLARQMIELCGLRPDLDIQIKITGLKPGEKLTEDLLDTNEEAIALSAGLSELKTRNKSVGPTDVEVDHLVELARHGAVGPLREAVGRHIAAIRGGLES